MSEYQILGILAGCAFFYSRIAELLVADIQRIPTIVAEIEPCRHLITT